MKFNKNSNDGAFTSSPSSTERVSVGMNFSLQKTPHDLMGNVNTLGEGEYEIDSGIELLLFFVRFLFSF
jgi:hypothetical protein